MSWGGAFDVLFWPEVRVSVHNDCPLGGMVLPPSSHVPRFVQGGGCFLMKFIAALMCTVASPDPNPNGRGQLPNPSECNSTLTNETRGETL